MAEPPIPGAYGVLVEPSTLKIERLLPGPIERIWAYLTEDKLRRQWLAAGDMELKIAAPFELIWRNDELSISPGERPPGVAAESRMQSRIIAVDPPHKLVFSWGVSGEVSFDLVQVNDRVRLTVTHRRLPDRATTLKIGAGWHAHLDTLVARATGEEPTPFWNGWKRLHDDYDRRIPI